MNHEPPSSPPDFERTDATPGFIVSVGACLFVLIGLGALTAAWILPEGRPPTHSGGPPTDQAGPTDAEEIQRAWVEQEGRVRGHLEGYAWIDRPAGLVQIPIDRAMELQANKAPP